MEIIFIAGAPCSGKSMLTNRLVDFLGNANAVRLPMDHYFLDVMCAEEGNPEQMSGYRRDRIDWELLATHIATLKKGDAIDTPRYDWDKMTRLPQNANIGRSKRIDPCRIVFVDGMHPTLSMSDKHIYVNPAGSVKNLLIEKRRREMPIPANYAEILHKVLFSVYGESLAWLENHHWQKISNPLSLDLKAFCRSCGWEMVGDSNKLVNYIVPTAL